MAATVRSGMSFAYYCENRVYTLTRDCRGAGDRVMLAHVCKCRASQ